MLVYHLCTILNLELGYHVPSHQCWDIMYDPKIRARILYTILGHVLVYSGPKLGTMAQIRANEHFSAFYVVSKAELDSEREEAVLSVSGMAGFRSRS